MVPYPMLPKISFSLSYPVYWALLDRGLFGEWCDIQKAEILLTWIVVADRTGRVMLREHNEVSQIRVPCWKRHGGYSLPSGISSRGFSHPCDALSLVDFLYLMVTKQEGGMGI